MHLAPTTPRDIDENSDECWMVDLRIANPEQELWYSNATPWWRLPRKPSMSRLFTRFRPQRVVCDNRISFEVAAKDARLDLEIPSNRNIFRHLLAPELSYHLAADLRSTLTRQDLFELRLSDKGRYLSGILGLSGGLKNSLYFFEHPFWRSLLLKLSRPDPHKHLTDKLTSDVRKLLDKKGTIGDADLSSFLTHEIILASRQLSRNSKWLTFREVEELYTEYLNTVPSEEKTIHARNLRSDLSELTKENILFQGVALRCRNCISSYWYSIEEMHKSISCRGCHEAFPLPAEPPWSYQLNELIRSGIGDHGLLPVIRTLARLFHGASDCFFFTPSVDFISYERGGAAKLERELDLAWIKDGRFGIAEIKNTTKLFKPADYESLTELAFRTDADIVLVAAPDGDNAQITKASAAIAGKLQGKSEVWSWVRTSFRSPLFGQHSKTRLIKDQRQHVRVQLRRYIQNREAA